MEEMGEATQVETNPMNLKIRRVETLGDFRRLSYTEMLEKKEKGLCFKCDEKFGPNHVCKFKQFRIMLMEESEEEEEGNQEEGATIEEPTQQFSLMSMMGLTSKKAWRLWGSVHGKKVIILVDCGASTNYVSKELVKELQLTVSPTK